MYRVEPPTRIERATYGLRIIPSTVSANLTSQETTKPNVSTNGAGGAGLFYPGSGALTEDSVR